MKLFKVIYNNRGMSLVNVLMEIGLTSILGLTMMRMTRTSTRAQMGLKANNEFIELTSLIQSRLLRRDYCDYSFGNNHPSLTYQIEDTAPDENQITVTHLVKPVFTFNQTTQQLEFQEAIQEFIIPDDVDMDDPKTGLQYGTISLMQMNLVRMPNSSEIFLELIVMPRNAGTAGVQTRSKRIPLQVVLNDSNEIQECYSDFGGTVASARRETCESGFGGTYSESNNSPDCTDTVLHNQVCALEQRVMGLTLTPGTDSCGNTVSITTHNKEFGPGTHTFNFPTAAIAGTLTVNLIGGGGGGAEGDRTNGACGGKAASENTGDVIGQQPGTTCSVTVGSGGAGGDDSNHSNSRPGSDGGDTKVVCSSLTLTSDGARGAEDIESGCKTSNDGRNGDNTLFDGAVRNGGSGGRKTDSDSATDGRPGSYGSGGGGGAEKSDGNDDPGAGGRGGHGAVRFKWKQLLVTP